MEAGGRVGDPEEAREGHGLEGCVPQWSSISLMLPAFSTILHAMVTPHTLSDYFRYYFIAIILLLLGNINISRDKGLLNGSHWKRSIRGSF